MSIVLKKEIIYKSLLAICIAVPYVGSYELTFLIWALTVFITLQIKYSFQIFKQISCFIIIIMIAVLSTNFESYNLFYIIRDFTYLLKPILGLILGYQLCKYNYKHGFKTIIYIGFLISIIHLIFLFSAATFRGANTVNRLREYGGYFSDFEIYALIILIFYKRFDIELSKNRFNLMLLVIGFSSFMYLSRANFIQFFILLMALKGYYVLSRRALYSILTVVVVTLISYGAILIINPKRNGNGIEAFLYKVKIAPIEPFKQKINFDDYIDFNDNYRSVELRLTVRQMSASGFPTILFGKGLGSKVDLHRKIRLLGETKLQYISVLHNGFMTTYLKSGVFGVLVLIFSIYLVYQQPRSNIYINQQINFLLVGTAFFLVISNWVLMGYFFTEDVKSLLVGFFIAFKELTNKNQALITNDLKPSGL